MELSFVLVSGLTLSCMYALLAVGISLVFSSLGVVNMAHGMSFTLAGYGAWLASVHLGPSAWIVVTAALLSGAMSGLLICALAFLPLHDKPAFLIRSLIATLALSLLGTQVPLWFFGPGAKKLPDLFGTQNLILFGMSIPADKVGSIACSLLLMVVVLWWMTRSRGGLAIRAMMQNPEGAALVAIGLRRTALAVMVVAGAMAGLAAVLLSQTYFVSPFGGTTPLVKGLIVALCGGLGSVPGAIAAAALIGFLEAFTNATLGARWVLMVQFGFIIAVLLVRPRGIGGLLARTRE